MFMNRKKMNYPLRVKNSFYFCLVVVCFFSCLLNTDVAKALSKNSFIIYEHDHHKGKKRTFSDITKNYSENKIYSIKGTKLHDEVSSMKWNFQKGIKVTLTEHNDGSGRFFTMTGTGQDKNTKNNNFKDCMSAWKWEGLISNNSFIIYKHDHYRGKSRTFSDITKNYKENKRYSIKGTKLHDEVSSMKWNLPKGIEVVLTEHNDGEGRYFNMTGKGKDKDTKNNNFKDCMSSWKWLGPIPENTVILYEHTNFKGKKRTIRNLTSYKDNHVYILDDKLHDKMSSFRWNLPPGVKFEIFEHKDGKGNSIVVERKDSCSSVKPGTSPLVENLDVGYFPGNKGFCDMASSWMWYTKKETTITKKTITKNIDFKNTTSFIQMENEAEIVFAKLIIRNWKRPKDPKIKVVQPGAQPLIYEYINYTNEEWDVLLSEYILFPIKKGMPLLKKKNIHGPWNIEISGNPEFVELLLTIKEL